jgi:hypothetical protein
MYVTEPFKNEYSVCGLSKVDIIEIIESLETRPQTATVVQLLNELRHKFR